jgi:hypothetical protein
MIVDWNDFFRWMESPEGQQAEQACWAVQDALRHAEVDTTARTILWEDGAQLSIAETARRIGAKIELPLETIESNVIAWLEMHYVPQGLDDSEMEAFEERIEQWIKHHAQNASDQ